MNNSAALKTKSKKGFYFTEILMLKSIIALLILTFFLLNEMQASNHESKTIDSHYKVCDTNPENQ